MFTGCDQDKANITIAHKLLIFIYDYGVGFFFKINSMAEEVFVLLQSILRESVWFA